jgi:hypothetical protein
VEDGEGFAAAETVFGADCVGHCVCGEGVVGVGVDVNGVGLRNSSGDGREMG